MNKLGIVGIIAATLIGAVTLAVILILFNVISFGAGVVERTANEAVETGFEELGPAALNDKYEWFKDAASSLNAKLATISMHQSKIDALREDYGDTPRTEWARDDRQSLNQWRQELDGIKASYNLLAAQYNAEMAKWHTRFVNAGMMPEGGDGTVKREFAPFIDE